MTDGWEEIPMQLQGIYADFRNKLELAMGTKINKIELVDTAGNAVFKITPALEVKEVSVTVGPPIIP